MRKRFMLHFVLIMMITFWLSCTKKPDDNLIKSDIQNKVNADADLADLKDNGLEVDSAEGKVTIHGTVETEAERIKAKTLAKAEPGVVSVEDEIIVDPSAETLAASQPLAAAGTAPAGTAPAAGGSSAAAPEPAPEPAKSEPEPPPPPKPVVLPAGTIFNVRLGEPLSSKNAQPGQTFAASMANPITVGGRTVIPSGSSAQGVVRDAKKAGKFKGGAVLTLDLTALTIKGHTYNINTVDLSRATKGKGKRTAGVVAGGAGAGAAIGGLAGGGKGAGIGALVGVTAGTIGAATTGNDRDIQLASEAVVSFELEEPLTLKPE
ncbi:Putative phosphoslipid binding protein [Candidatus Koribacter versatilis Ellin345]|uniref:Phosphoslipid binding protein n=1 Tax=Koribacter versatilis (strain Ellin345) TaxID=204669 RepID=Q1IJ85_KORVE|nr:BON domain-containing protein [Candidatus Koribacter versatilis]ABF43065.1 Putative phosphoslipid binding protein [Candidatus Koribacter versatilis Ellin345]